MLTPKLHGCDLINLLKTKLTCSYKNFRRTEARDGLVPTNALTSTVRITLIPLGNNRVYFTGEYVHLRHTKNPGHVSTLTASTLSWELY